MPALIKITVAFQYNAQSAYYAKSELGQKPKSLIAQKR
jgi:hypothetical protein